ncbi:hypothetical protein KR52_05410 [Synechococcus sp. KORDI-52]|nr:hypothetical protein KR52_05410 [Synechococcus sp. KORDI-52]
MLLPEGLLNIWRQGMNAWEIPMLLIGGAFAGALNTLASSGSAITLPLLILLGVPPGIANGTNRLGVLLGSFSAVISFQKAKSIPWRKTLVLSAPLATGAILGARAATYLNDDRIQLVINIAIFTALAILVIGSKRFIFLKESRQDKESRFILPALFLVGFWTGFIVLDSATYMILALVMLGSMDVTEANPIKAVFLLTASILSIPIFFLEGKIDWVPGITLAAGGALGSWWAAKVALQPWIKKWIYFLLIAVVSIELIVMIIGN